MADKKKMTQFVAKAMSDCGQTQKQIGDAMGMHQSSVSRKLKGVK